MTRSSSILAGDPNGESGAPARAAALPSGFRKALVWLVVVVVGALVAHACGYAFGVANQATYFLEALHRAHPELLRHDWLVMNTSEYHSAFGFFAGALFRIDDSGAIVFGIAHVLFMVTLMCGVFLVVRGVTAQAALSAFLLVVGWFAVDGVHSIAGSYLWSCYLQPSLIASAGWMLALAMHVRGRPLATGIALAIGGVFHINFLLLGIGMFGLAELIADKEQRGRRLALLLAPQLVALAILAPELLANAGGSDPSGALWVLVQFHAPLHYEPSRIVVQLPTMLRWVALAIVVAPVASKCGKRPEVRRLLWWSIIAGTICAVATLIMMIPALLPLSRLYVWRLAPFSVATAAIVIAISVMATITDPSCWREQPLWRRVVAIVLVVAIAADSPFLSLNADATWLLWPTVAAIVFAFALPLRSRNILLVVLALGTLAAPLWYRRNAIINPPTGIGSDGPDADGLYAWAQTSSPTDSVFMTPPDLFRFRLVARRAVYADFKSPPLAPDDLLEWHARLCRMNGALPTDKIPAHRRRWLDATGDALLARSRELGIDYLVLDRTPSHDRIAARPVFSNDSFAVFAVH
ncbi:MAG TPA: DUF6798 domain-containing protein [Kofleriaceae bacterium]